MSEVKTPNRCRVVLVAPPPGAAGEAARLDAALSAGDVASLIIPQWTMDEAAFQAHAERLTRAAQARGVAAVVAGEPRIAARVGADGIHVEATPEALGEAVDKYQTKMMVGCGGARNRNDALELGERQPDYIFFGRFGYDVKPEPHPRNLALGWWWAQMIRIPCIVLGGADIASVKTVAATGAEFVALGTAVLAEGADPAAMVAEANRLLDAHAPTFEDTAE